MNKKQYILILFAAIFCAQMQAQDTDDYIEFNDRKNVVHGVYLGLNFLYGEVDGEGTYLAGAKIAYVANQKFEVGLAGVGFYSDQSNNVPLPNMDIYGGYGGVHVEPIFFGDATFSLALPMLVGGGAVTYTLDDFESYYPENWESFFVFEPGLSVLYNVSSYIQFELGIKYRWTSDFDLYAGGIENLNGFSGGIGLKIGVFNLGKK